MVTKSIQPRKQRKARYTAPAHIRGKYLSATLSQELRDQYKRRSLRVVKGDTVKVMRGDAKGEEGLVDDVDVGKGTLTVHGVTLTKADNTEVPRPVDPSNVRLTKLNLKDPRRAERLGEVE